MGFRPQRKTDIQEIQISKLNEKVYAWGIIISYKSKKIFPKEFNFNLVCNKENNMNRTKIAGKKKTTTTS